jgi:hypothetical protein
LSTSLLEALAGHVRETQTMCHERGRKEISVFQSNSKLRTSDLSDGESISEIAESELIQFFLIVNAAESEEWKRNSQTFLLTG